MFGTGVKKQDKDYKKLLDRLGKQYKKDYFMALAIKDVQDNLSKVRGARSDYLDMTVELGVASTSKLHNWKWVANQAVRNNYAEVKKVYEDLGLDVSKTQDASEIYRTVMDYKFATLKKIVDSELKPHG
ncbi:MULTISPECIES: hypothetical protein [Bhargavaea]|uniref:Uncharacterized protein n=1 Tax=Bhargavaea changchunensis TaxID=2134037 RepID=A0ABW2ND16_9BACL|nr:hypothetical protein [Bhargavaea sp. CC-171006]